MTLTSLEEVEYAYKRIRGRIGAASADSSKYKGVIKKMTVTSILFVTCCAGNIAGPQTFISTEAKRFVNPRSPLKLSNMPYEVIPPHSSQSSFVMVW